jgi:hypothetical protein
LEERKTMSDTDLTSFERQLRSGLAHEADRLNVSAGLTERAHARIDERNRHRRAGGIATVVAVTVITIAAIVVPRVMQSSVQPAGLGSAGLPTVHLRPGSAVDLIDAPSTSVLYGFWETFTPRTSPSYHFYVVRSLDGGQTWRAVSHDPCVTEVVTALTFVNTQDGIATCPTRIVGTQDGGRTWTPVPSLGQPGAVSALGTGPVGSAAASQGTIWALTLHCSSSVCIRRISVSTTGGSSWQVGGLNLGTTSWDPSSRTVPNAQPSSIAITGPESGYVLLGGGHEATRLYKTSDNWKTWSSVPVPCGSQPVGNYSIELIAHSPSLLYLYCGSETPGKTTAKFRFYTSLDGGQSWDLRTATFPTGFYRSSNPEAFVFLATTPDNLLLQSLGTLVHSSDGGRTWHAALGGGAVQLASWVHFSSPEHGVLFDESSAGYGWWVTDDGGAVWKQVSAG